MNIIQNLPPELQQNIAKYLSIQDLGRCAKVSKACQQMFDSDIFWEHIAKEKKIKNRTVIAKEPSFLEGICYKNPKPQIKSFKNLVHSKILEEEDFISKNWPSEFLYVFGTARAIRRLPSLDLTSDDLVSVPNDLRKTYYFKDEHFLNPITKVSLFIEGGESFYSILIRVKNNINGQIYRDAISFYTLRSSRFFDIEFENYKNRIISPVFLNVTEQKLFRFKRLINRKPVGMIISERRYTFEEGPRSTPDGKSVLELV